MRHLYIFVLQPHGPVYDRTVPAEWWADMRVAELKSRGHDAVWLDVLPDHWWY